MIVHLPGSLAFAVLGGFYWKKANTAGAIFSILTGIFSGLFSWCYYGGNQEWLLPWVMIGIPFVFLSGFVVSYLVHVYYKRPNSPHYPLNTSGFYKQRKILS